jgi:hypothetical protein
MVSEFASIWLASGGGEPCAVTIKSFTPCTSLPSPCLGMARSLRQFDTMCRWHSLYQAWWDLHLTFCMGATAAAAPVHSAFIVLYCAFTATAPEAVATYAWYAVWHCSTGPVP